VKNEERWSIDGEGSSLSSSIICMYAGSEDRSISFFILTCARPPSKNELEAFKFSTSDLSTGSTNMAQSTSAAFLSDLTLANELLTSHRLGCNHFTERASPRKTYEIWKSFLLSQHTLHRGITRRTVGVTLGHILSMTYHQPLLLVQEINHDPGQFKRGPLPSNFFPTISSKIQVHLTKSPRSFKVHSQQYEDRKHHLLWHTRLCHCGSVRYVVLSY
jgi:hypothetical protein